MHRAIQVFVDGLQAKLGIYNDEAVRASAHNSGTQHLPRRHWFGATLTDLADMANEIAGRIDRRMRGKA